MQIFAAKDIFCAIILLIFEFAWQTNGKFGTEFAIRLLRQVKSESARRNEFAYFMKGHTMKRLLLIITLVLFSAGFISEAFAAPARGGGAATKRTAKKATTAKKRVATKKVAKKPLIQRAPAEEAVSKLTEFQQDFQASQAKKRGKEQQLGLMPSEINILNHNVFHADAAAIRGARETEQALRYLPFVTVINTAGFGYNFDIRGQGRLSSNGVKMFINGVPVTPVDSYFQPMPIHTLIPSNIQEIEVFPGSGAVLYGSGTKGGTINIITSKRQNPYFLVGGGYVNTTASKGNSFNAFAQAAENLGRDLKVNAALAASVLGGPRTDDSSLAAQATLGAEYKMGVGQAISFDADAYYGKVKTTPYNSLLDFDNINEFMRSTLSLPGQSLQGYAPQSPYEENRYMCLAGMGGCAFGTNDFEPTDEDRATPGYGTIDTTQIRATAKINYFSQLARRLEFNAAGFADFDSKKYNEHKMNTPFFVLGYIDPKDLNYGPNGTPLYAVQADGTRKPTHYNKGYNWFLPRVTHPYRVINSGWTTAPAIIAGATLAENVLVPETGPVFKSYTDMQGNVIEADGERADWQFIDQSGSKFDEYKFGVKPRIDWRHQNGLFVFGIDLSYEMSKRNSKTYLRQAIADGSAMGGVKGYNNNYQGTDLRYGSAGFSSLMANIEDKTDINVLTTGVYFLERYDMSRELSLGLGARYEMKNYNVKIKDSFEGKKLAFKDLNADGTYCNGNANCPDFVDYESGTVLQTTNKAGVDNPDGIATHEADGDYSQNHDNFTFELAPVYRYSGTGLIYARGELGYNAPPAWAMLRRIGIVWGATNTRDNWQQMSRWDANNQSVQQLPDATPFGKVLEFDFDFENTDLKNETYYTAELGWKETIGRRIVPLGLMDIDITGIMLSASVFYTGSQNEFYFEGDTWSGMTFGNYKESRRIGAEVAAEQYLFGGLIGFNESFTYLKAQHKDAELGWAAIPYTYDWKATLGAAVDISGYLEVVDVGVSIWLQNSIYGNQNIYSTRINVIPGKLDTANAETNTPAPIFVTQREEKKLNPYLVSDFGLTVNINKGMGTVTAGVKNVFNSFYYDYYNNDRSAVVNENRYVIGRGRTVFLEGTFKY